MTNEKFRLKIVNKIESIKEDIDTLEKQTLKQEGKESLGKIYLDLENVQRVLKYSKRLYDD